MVTLHMIMRGGELHGRMFHDLRPWLWHGSLKGWGVVGLLLGAELEECVALCEESYKDRSPTCMVDAEIMNC
jgi:hypothetical protein